MVMGKVSKAIVTSFLCLSLFNAGSGFAGAMIPLGNSTNNNNNIDSSNNGNRLLSKLKHKIKITNGRK